MSVPKFDTSTLNRGYSSSGSATVEAASDRAYITEGDAFTLMFTLPYRREDVYRELVSPRQLGVDHTTVKISVTKRSDAAEERLQRKLRESARGNEASEIKQHLQESALAELSVGCERTVNFPDGVVVSELVELVDNQRIRWRQVRSERATNMVGKPGGALPEVTIALDELPDASGTSVRMTYDFYQILKQDGTPLDGSMMSKLLGQATKGWSVDMKNRGYETVDGGEALTGRPGYPSGGSAPAQIGQGGSVVLRSARRMKDDVQEEEEMKRAMMERAAAKMK